MFDPTIILPFLPGLLIACVKEKGWNYTSEPFELGPVRPESDLRMMLRRYIVRRSCELLEAGAKRRFEVFRSGHWREWRDQARREVLDQMVEMIRTVMPMLPLGSDIKEDLVKDAELFATQVKQLQPKMGSVSAVTYEVEQGFETVTYNWSENKTLDDSKPLTIVEHLGGDPIAFYASRPKRFIGPVTRRKGIQT